VAHRQANKIQVSEKLASETCKGLNERGLLRNLIFRTSNPYNAYSISFEIPWIPWAYVMKHLVSLDARLKTIFLSVKNSLV
jgi:hypothetical protein